MTESGIEGQVAEGVKVPAALRPGTEEDDEGVEITSDPYDAPVTDKDALLERWGFSPKEYEVVNGTLKVSQWETQTPEGIQQLWSYKATVRQRDSVRTLDFDDLIKEVKSHKKKAKQFPSGSETFVINVADTQFGKNDGDGVKGTIERFQDSTDAAIDRLKELRKIGRDIGTVVVAGLGDIIEGCDGQYASQPYNVELNRRQQTRLARRLIFDLIKRVSSEANEVIITAVPGNHGENRANGRAFTTPGDNDDVAIFEEIHDILTDNPEVYGHVSFALPEDEIYTILDLHGTKIGFAHGHIAGTGSSPQKKIWDWWSNQIVGCQPIAEAKILVTGHYHHFSVIEYNMERICIQCPSVESESTWWKNLKGQVSPPGLLTFVVGSYGYRDLQVV